MNPQRCVMGMIGLILTGLVVGCSTSGPAPEGTSGAVESRGVPHALRPPAALHPMQEPIWPQQFEVQGPESASFGFAVTQPGPVVMEVQIQEGAPVIVTLQGPAPQPDSPSSSGQVRRTYNVTPQDVQKSLFWAVQIQLAQPVPPKQGGRARGSVMVQHPPTNLTQVQAAISAHQQAVQQQVAQRHAQEQQVGAQVAAQMEASFQQRKAQLEQQRRQHHAALMAGVQPALDQMRARGQGRIGTRGTEGSEAAAGEPRPQGTEEIGTRGFNPSPLMQLMPLTVVQNPAINSLSATQGQPGDPVMITGSGFSNDGGEVHFIINPGKDVLAHVDFWSDASVFVTVPDASGILAFNGQAYVVRASDKMKSNPVSFRFNPALEIRHFNYHPDVILKQPQIENCYGHPDNAWCRGKVDRYNNYWFAGFSENDEFLPRTRLKNGWVLDEVYLYPEPGSASGASIADKKVGTDWPYFNVRWWMNACLGSPGWVCTFLSYRFDVTIQGPKGIPDGIVVP